MKLQEVTAYNLRSQTILNESWDVLTESQRIYLGKFERELWPLMEELVRLCEAELTPDQIKNIFTSAEQQAAGQRTGLGKAKDVAGAAVKLPGEVLKKINAKVNELGKMAQDTGPVKNADAQFEKLKAKIAGDNPKLADQVKKVGDWMKANPGKASLAIGILTAAAAFAAGPAGGAAAGMLLRSTKELMQGEKLSTAVGKSAKTAAIGALAGMAFDAIGDTVVDNIAAAGEADINAMEAALKAANVEDAMAEIDPELQALIPELNDTTSLSMSGNINNFYFNYDVIMDPEQQATYNSLRDAMSGAKPFSEEYYQAAGKFHDFMAGVANDPEQVQLKQALEALKAAQASDTLSIEQLDQLIDQEVELTDKLNALVGADKAVAAAAQAAAQEATADKENAVKASPPKQGELDLQGGGAKESLSMEERFELYLAEAPKQGKLGLDNPNSMGAKMKAGVKGALGKAKSAVQQKGKDITQQVTANKLMKAWKAAGEPTDTGSIVNILASAGVSDDQIATIGQEQKVKLPAPTKAPAADKAAAPQAGGEQPAAAPQAGGEQPAAAPQAGGAVDVKSIAAEIKKLPPEAVQEIKAALQKEIGTPAAKPRTGGKQKGVLSQTPSAIRRRQATAARRAADAGLSVSKPAAAPAAPAAPKVKK